MRNIIFIFLGIILIVVNISTCNNSNEISLVDSQNNVANSLGRLIGSSLLGIIGTILILIGYFYKRKSHLNEKRRNSIKVNVDDEKDIEIINSPEYIESLNQNKENDNS